MLNVRRHSSRSTPVPARNILFAFLVLHLQGPFFSILLAQVPSPVQHADAVVDLSESEEDLIKLVDYQRHLSKRLDRYAELDALIWWAGDSELPELLTTSPGGTALANAGLLGNASTSVLHGNETIGDWPHVGLRLRLGRYFRRSVPSRIELGLWTLFQGQDRFNASSSGGDPILTRPFFNTAASAQDAQVLSFPGIADGRFDSEYQRQAAGLEPLLFVCLWNSGCNWLEFFSGYRLLWLKDEITLREDVTLTPGGLIAPGTRFAVEDNFQAENFYHLLPLGLSWSGNRGKWNWNLRGEIGVGFVAHRIRIRGQTDSFIGDTLTGSEPAGLLALGTNSGTHTKNRFAWVPQLAFSGRRSLTDSLSLNVGYTLIYLDDAVQAANHIPTSIDPGNIPPVTPGAGASPSFAYTNDSILMHGINFGLRYGF